MEAPSRRDKERQARREDILSAAEAVFSQNGFESASMDEIARVAQFTKRTVYQYFGSKEDLLFAVVLRLRQRLFACIEAALADEGTGHERIRRAARAYYSFYGEYTNVLRLANLTGHLRAHGDKSANYKELMELGPQMFLEFGKAVAAGQADGSIRTDLDARTGACAIAFILTGFFNLLADSGPAFTGSLGLDQGEFVNTILGLLDDALRPGAAPPGPRSDAPQGKRKRP